MSQAITDFLLNYGYWGMLLAAFLAGSFFPFSSEAVMLGLYAAGLKSDGLIVYGTIGNVLGSAVNWLLGRGIERFRDRCWFPVGPAALDRAQGWYHRHGKWSLLLSWAPIVGDPLTVVAGLAREPLPVFLLLVTIAKFGRYAVLAALTLGVT